MYCKEKGIDCKDQLRASQNREKFAWSEVLTHKEEIAYLRGQLHRRNIQIADLKKRIELGTEKAGDLFIVAQDRLKEINTLKGTLINIFHYCQDKPKLLNAIKEVAGYFDRGNAENSIKKIIG